MGEDTAATGVNHAHQAAGPPTRFVAGVADRVRTKAPLRRGRDWDADTPRKTGGARTVRYTANEPSRSADVVPVARRSAAGHGTTQRRRLIQMRLNSAVQSGPRLDLVPDLPEPDRQMGHRCTGVRATTLGYDHGYRLPPSVDRFVDRRYGYLLTHSAVSTLICTAATEADIDPDRVKFKRTVRILRRRAADPAFSP